MAYLNTINANLTSAGSAGSVRVGFLESATPEPNGFPTPVNAALQEFGGGNGIPPRPYFRTMIKTNAPSWGDDVAKVLKATNFNAEQTLGHMGQKIAGQLRHSIRDLTSPPLAASTIRKKSRGKVSKLAWAIGGPAKPLIDTGHMLNSVDYEVST